MENIAKPVDLAEIIKKVIHNIEFNNKGYNGKKLFEEFNLEDFDYTHKYHKLYGENSDVIKFISFCLRNFWAELATKEINKDIWEEEFKTFNFLKVMFGKINALIEAYDELFQRDKTEVAFSLFRNYIELSSILFASSLDYTFFRKYTLGIESNPEYTQHWFKNLKPQAIVKLLKGLNKGNNKLTLPEHFIETFSGNQRTKLYEFTSAISHSRFSHIVPSIEQDLNYYRIVATDFLVESTLLIHSMNHQNIAHGNDKEPRKLQIIAGVWFEVLYQNILK